MKVWTWVGIGVIGLAALWVLARIQSVLPPFVYALIFVYLLRPVVNGLEDRGVNRILAIVIAYLIIIALLALLLLIIVPVVVNETRSLISSLPVHFEYFKRLLFDVLRTVKVGQSTTVTGFLDRITGSFSEGALAVAKRIPETAGDIFGGAFNLVLAPLLAFYILKDLRVIKRTIEMAIPAKFRDEGMDIVHKVDQILGGFLKGQMLVALSVGVLVGLAMALLGIKYALLLGVISAIFNIIPYLGPIVSGLPATLIALETSTGMALIVVAVLFVIHQFDSLFISPNIMSQQVDLHPTVVIFALLTGGTLFGIMGMLMAIPVAAVGKAIYLHFREKHGPSDEVEPPTTKSGRRRERVPI